MRCSLNTRASRSGSTKERNHEITVSIRIRPLQSPTFNGENAVQVDPSTGILNVKNKVYKFADHIICGSDQTICYDVTSAPLISKLITGVSCCLLAYGQTGSGKTHTMFGPQGELTEAALNQAQGQGNKIPMLWGLFPRVALEILQLEALYSMQASVVEIYQDSAFDLLDNRKALSLGNTKAKGKDFGNGTVHPSGCYCKKCFNAKQDQPSGAVYATRQQLTNSIQVAQLARTVELTRVAKGHLLNARSSRSHCIVSLYVTLKQGDKYVSPTFLFVDLAGSERIKKSGVVGEASKEATRINSSLTILGRVTKALADRSTFVPYRDSTLTRLLQPIFTGQACASYIVNIASESQHFEETKMSLQFAQRLKGMRVRPVVAVEGWELNQQQQQLENEIKILRDEIERMEQKGYHGHFGPNAINTEKISLQQNMNKLEQLETNVNKLRIQMKEISEKSPEYGHIELQLHSEQAKLEIIQGVVAREKTIKSLWIPPTKLYTQKYNELKQLEAMLQITC